jgi:phage terminase large subunit GpA-like protein
LISRVSDEATSEQVVLTEFLDSCTPPPLRGFAEWAESEIILPSGPFVDYEFRCDRLPFSKLLLNEFGKWERHIITGPTQSGKSLLAFVLVIMYHLFELREDVIVGVPDINMAGDKWSEDIKPVILSSSYADQLPTSGPGSKGAERLTKIRFRNSKFLRFMSAGGNDKQRAGATARVLVVTETDGMDVVAETSQEGQTKMQQIEGRVRAFGDSAVIFAECTTSTEDAYTRREYLAGTASKIVHPCGSCGEWVSPEREHFVGWEDAPDMVTAGKRGAFTCPSCGVYYTEEDRQEMNQNARLIHRGQSITPEGEIVGPIPPTNTLGFRWSAFQNLLTSMKKLAQEEWTALQTDDPTVAQIMRNQQVWAMPAENPNIEKVPISVSIVRGSDPKYAGRCSGLDRGEVPGDCEYITAMIDIGRRVLSWEVVAWCRNHSHTIDYGFHETEQPDVVGDAVAISDALTCLTDELEAKYVGLKIGLIDCGNWRDVILNWVQSSQSRIWKPSHGLSDYRHPTQYTRQRRPSPNGDHWHLSRDTNGIWVVNFDPNRWKHVVHSAFLIQPITDSEEIAAGCIQVYGDNPKAHGEFAAQITAERWEEEFKKGRSSGVSIQRAWKKYRRDNHMLDCRVGNFVARSIVESNKILQNDGRKWSEIVAKKQAVQSSE